MCYLSVLLSDFCFFPLRLLSLCSVLLLSLFFFFFKQKTAYEMRISDWSSDVCSSDLEARSLAPLSLGGIPRGGEALEHRVGLGAFGQRRQPPDFEAATRPHKSRRAGIADAVAVNEAGKKTTAIIERVRLGVAEAFLELGVLVEVEVAQPRGFAVALDLAVQPVILILAIGDEARRVASASLRLSHWIDTPRPTSR